jgi:predicted NBD/HSP70 family sugar kinase
MNPFDKPLSLNERRLVELVYRNGAIARIDLTQATDMTGASVTRLTAGLEELGLFEQKTDKSGARGQPKKLLSIRRTAFRAIGIYLYLDRMVGVLIDFSGAVLGQSSCVVSDRNPNGILHDAHQLAKGLITDTGTKKNGFLGIGISVPGNFGAYGTLLKAHETFEELEGGELPSGAVNFEGQDVHIENDGTAAALGEYLFGRRETRDPLFLIHIGYGLGGGAVLGGRPYRGLNGNACLPGPLFPYGAPRPTLQDLQENLNKGGYDISDIRQSPPDVQLGNKVVRGWIERASEQMRFAVQVVSGMFDPEMIVIGGALPMPVTRELVQAINSTEIPAPSRGLSAAPVVATRLGDLNGPIGAAAIPFFRTFFPGSSVERGSAYLDGRAKKAL